MDGIRRYGMGEQQASRSASEVEADAQATSTFEFSGWKSGIGALIAVFRRRPFKNKNLIYF